MGRSGEEGKKYDLAVLAAARLFLKDPRPETTKRFFAIVNWYTCFMSNESGACEDCPFYTPEALHHCAITETYQQNIGDHIADFSFRLAALIAHLETTWGVDSRDYK